MKNFFKAMLLVVGLPLVAQNNVNNYKYVIVPTMFNFQKSENQFRINTLTKLLLEEAGFTAAYENNLPADYNNNVCGSLKADVVNESSMFSTKLKVVFRDCRNNTVFTSEEGKSKIKSFEPAYQEALREAFKSVKALNYSYNPPDNDQVLVNPQPTETNLQQKQETVQTTVEAAQNNPMPVESSISAEVKPSLYAQPVENGFQLVDTEPKVVFVLKKTGLQNVFILHDKNGVLYKSGDSWVAEYYEGNQKVQKIFSIKF